MLFRNYTIHTSVNLVFINNQLETLYLNVHQLHAFIITHSPHRDKCLFSPYALGFPWAAAVSCIISNQIWTGSISNMHVHLTTPTALHPAHTAFPLLSLRYYPRPWTILSPTAWACTSGSTWTHPQVWKLSLHDWRVYWSQKVETERPRLRECWHFQEILLIHLSTTPTTHLWQIKSKLCEWVYNIQGKGQVREGCQGQSETASFFIWPTSTNSPGPEASS